MKRKMKITKRILSMVLCVVMVLGCCSIEALAAGGMETPDRHTDFFGNGTPLYIDEGTSSGKTVVYYLNGSEKVYLNANGAAGDDLSKKTVFGGTRDKALYASTSVTMYGGNVASIAGGGSNSTQYGDFRVTIHGGTVGGVDLCGTNINGNQTGNCFFTMTGGKINGRVMVINGDNLAGNVSVTMTGGSAVDIYVAPAGSNLAVTGNANVIVAGDSNLEGGIIFQTNAGGHSMVKGTVTCIAASGSISSLYGDPMAQLDTGIYNQNGTWKLKGNPEIPEGITLKIDAGENFTVGQGYTITNNGTIVNNGTMSLNGSLAGGTLKNNGTLNLTAPISGYTLENNGTVNHRAVYVSNVSSVSALKVWQNEVEVSPGYHILDNKLYLFTGAGNIKAEVNGKNYYGVYSGTGEMELSGTFISVTGIDGVPAKAYKNVPITLPTKAVPENISVTNEVSWKCLSGNATANENVVTPTADSGVVKIQATVKNGLGYGEDFTKVYEIAIEDGNVFNIENGSIKVTGNADGSMTIVQRLAAGDNETLVSNDELVVITGQSDTNRIDFYGSKVRVQFDSLNPDYTKLNADNVKKAIELNLTGTNDVNFSMENVTLTVSGSGKVNYTSTRTGYLFEGSASSELTINGGFYNASTYDGGMIMFIGGSGTAVINGGTFRVTQRSSYLPYAMASLGKLVFTGGNAKFDTINANQVVDGNGNKVDYAEITLEGVGDGVAITDITGIEYGLTDVETIDGKFYVYAADVEKITSITAGGKTYVGVLVKTGTKAHNESNGKLDMYKATFFEGSVVNISGVQAEDAVYDGNPKIGYTGTITNDANYTGAYTITYTGRNGTQYDSATAPTNVGDYTVTFSVCDKNQKIAGFLSLDFSIAPIELKDVSVQLSEGSYVYDGTAKEPGVTVVDGTGKVYPAEEYQVTYQNNTNAGQASVVVTSKSGRNYVFETVAAFTISKATYDISGAKWDYTGAFTYDGLEKTVSVTGLPDGVTVSGYTDAKATAADTYTAKVSLTYDEDNYNTPVVADLTWEIKNDWEPVEFTTTTPNAAGWVREDFVITANDGYSISLTNTADGEWGDTLVGAAEGADNSITFYLKNNSTGAISLPKTVSYKLDKNTEFSATKGMVSFDERNSWETFLNTITFNLFFKAEVMVKVQAEDAVSGIASVEYLESSIPMSQEELIAARAAWASMPTEGVAVTVEDAKQFIYYVRITDNAGNVTYLSTDGAEYDTTAPSISGIENGGIYYTTQNVAVSDKHLTTVVLNDEAAGTEITLEGNKEATYTVVATDKAGNETTFVVTMKPVAALGEFIEDVTDENVKSSDKDAIQNVIDRAGELLEDEDLTEEEAAELENLIGKAEDLLDKIDEADKADETETIEKVKDITSENVTPEDEEDLENAKSDLEKTLEDYGDNYTDDEKKAIDDEIKRIDDALEVIKNVEEVESLINKIPDKITKNDEATIKAAEEAYNALSDYEKSLVDKNVKKDLDDAKAALKKVKKPAETTESTSPNTGDNSNLWMWFALLFVSGGALAGINVYGRKKNDRAR